MAPMEPLSLYLHIPFCRHRCSYCDFNTYTTVTELQDAYVSALARELKQVADGASLAGQLRPGHTVFFGGGTPSLLSVGQVSRLLDVLETAFGLVPEAEITMEANPETVDAPYLCAVRAAGINRLSYGMQSANNNELQLLGRTHGMDAVLHAVEDARAAGIENINLDLIYGLPDQDVASWNKSLQEALALQPPHLSLYCLTIEPGTPLRRRLHNGEILAPDPDVAATQYEVACDLLSAAGYEHYEISNWAKPGFQCRHNLAYWRDQEYLGLGAGAHGKAAGKRYQTVRQPRVYIRRMMEGESGGYPLSAAAAEWHDLDVAEEMSDRAITQLRLLQEGLDLAAFEAQFGQSFDEAFDEAAKLEQWRLLERDGSRLLLTRDGWFVSNQVFYRFV